MADLAPANAVRQTPHADVRWRVATIAHDGEAPWHLQPAEFAHKALAEEYAHDLLWAGHRDRDEEEQDQTPHADPRTPPRWRNAALVQVVDGVLQVPSWMRVREEEDG